MSKWTPKYKLNDRVHVIDYCFNREYTGTIIAIMVTASTGSAMGGGGCFNYHNHHYIPIPNQSTPCINYSIIRDDGEYDCVCENDRAVITLIDNKNAKNT